MHDSSTMHMTKPFQKSIHKRPYLSLRKFTPPVFHGLVESFPGQKLKHNVDRVIWLVNALKCDNVRMWITIEFSEDG